MNEYFHFIPLVLGGAALAISFFIYFEYYRNSKRGDRVTEAIQLVRSIISYNCIELTQYHFMGSELHNELKNSLMGADGSRIAKSLRQLDDYLSQSLAKVAQYNFAYLQEYFANRSKTIPRISLLGFKGDENAYTFVTNTVTKGDNAIYLVSGNTSLASVIKTGSYFLCNDVGLAAKQSLYIQEDQEDQEDQVQIGSTLVVPLSISKNALSVPFSELLNMHQIERKVFGLLAIDHPDKRYFKEDDVALVFIVSELLTSFLIAHSTFTVFSESYRKAHELIEPKTANKWFQPTLVESRG